MTVQDYLRDLRLPTSSAALDDLPTLHQGQCCNCVYDDGAHRVWVCRVEKGVTVEALVGGRWETVAGDCYDFQPET